MAQVVLSAPTLVASVLPADFAALGHDVEEIERAGDTGVGTIAGAAAAGATVFCAGSALFAGDGTMAERTATLRASATERLALR